MPLVKPVPRPAIQRIIQWHGGGQLFDIVAIQPRQADRHGQQPCGLRCQIMGIGICAPDNQRQPGQRLGLQPELGQHRIKGAAGAAM